MAEVPAADCRSASALESPPSDSAWPTGSWLAAQNRLLEMIASRAPIDEVLNSLARHLESESDQSLCSILTLVEGRLFTAAAPSLPSSFNDAICGAVIGPGFGSCGNAAFTGQMTIVEDIATHPYWANYKDLALSHGLRSCWSTPILSAEQEVLGTFAIYHRTVVGPSDRDFALLRGATHIAGIALSRQRSDDMLRRQAQALQTADRRKDIFLAALSHELRNPIAPILTTVQMIERMLDKGDTSKVRRGLKVIERQTRNLIGLIDDLLDLTRVTEGKIVLHKEMVAIAGLVQQAVDQVAGSMERRAHRLHLEVQGEPIIIYADPIRIVQVIANLLGNAAKYTPPGGDIWLTVSAREGGVELVVRDSGIGLLPEALPRIFDLYAQGEHPQARTHEGLGIGLTLVKSLVEQHGGRVQAASPGPGQGSEFRVFLPSPRADEYALAHKAAAPPPSPLRLSQRVLVVDDNEDAAEMLAAAMETTGCTVRLATSGQEALTTAAAWDPEVVILDIGLPDLDGCEVARRLRAQSRRRHRLIAVTGYGQPGDVARAVDAGFDRILTKPAELETILAAIAAE